MLSEIHRKKASNARQTLESSPALKFLYKRISRWRRDKVGIGVFNYYKSFAKTGHLVYGIETDPFWAYKIFLLSQNNLQDMQSRRKWAVERCLRNEGCVKICAKNFIAILFMYREWSLSWTLRKQVIFSQARIKIKTKSSLILSQTCRSRFAMTNRYWDESKKKRNFDLTERDTLKEKNKTQAWHYTIRSIQAPS